MLDIHYRISVTHVPVIPDLRLIFKKGVVYKVVAGDAITHLDIRSPPLGHLQNIDGSSFLILK